MNDGNLRGIGCSGRDRPPEANRPPSIVIFTIAIDGDEAQGVGCLKKEFLFLRGELLTKNSCHPRDGHKKSVRSPLRESELPFLTP
eukprot:scaffold34529_cov55-Cyclotella_meneghiniana.AAC.6